MDEHILDQAFKDIDSESVSIYHELAPIYSLLRQEKEEELSSVHSYIQEKLTDEKGECTIIEGGCKSGKMLAHLELEKSVTGLVGIEGSSQMVDLADKNIDHPILINSPVSETSVHIDGDIYIARRETIDRLSPDEFRDMVAAAYESISSPGLFIGQFRDKIATAEENKIEYEWETDSYYISVYGLGSSLTGNKSQIIYQVIMEDLSTSERKKRLFEEEIYHYTHNDVRNALKSAGFARVSFSTDPDFASEEQPVVVAWS